MKDKRLYPTVREQEYLDKMKRQLGFKDELLVCAKPSDARPKDKVDKVRRSRREANACKS